MTQKNNKYRALVGYPLSSNYRNLLEVIFNPNLDYLSVADLRRMTIAGLLQTLWSRPGETLLIPLEDVNSLALLPVLETLSAFSGARRILVVHPDMRQESVFRLTALLHFGRMLLASIVSSRSAKYCRSELKELLQARRVDLFLQNTNRDVLYLKTNLWFGVKAGGSVGHIAGVVNGFLDQGYDVQFAAAEEPVMLKEAVHFLPVDPPRVFGLPSELNYYRFQQQFVSQIINSKEISKPAFIYQRLSIANYAGVNLSRHFGVPLVLEYNGSEAWIAKNWGNPLRYHDLAVMAEDAALKHAHIVVTISEVLKDELLERGVAPERIVVYPNCVDPEVFTPDRFSKEEIKNLRNSYNIGMDAKVVTFVGTFGQWHGAEVLAKTVRVIAETDEEWLKANKVHFLFVGDGLKMPDVKKELGEFATSRFITLTGLVEQSKAPLHLAASDILISPHVANEDGSRFFGSPTKLFEYMAMGKGIVASELEQIGDILSPGLRINKNIENNSNVDTEMVAVLTTPGNVDELVYGIRFLVEQPDLCAMLGENARRKVLSHYTWRHHVEAIISGLHSNLMKH
jgi:glycosyltransferase involved in cell wall biosynthesis